MFEFPKADRSDAKSFTKHYLQSVIFQVKFDDTDEIGKKKQDITSIFKDQLPRAHDLSSGEFQISFTEQTPIVQTVNKGESGFVLRSMDGERAMTFKKDTISLTISGKVYKGFENIEEKLSNLYKVFKICGITSFNRVAIRKVNIIEFEIALDDTDHMQIMRMVLNDKLLNNIMYFPQAEYIKQNIHAINYVKENNRLHLRYGLIVPDVNSRNGQIIVDIDLFTNGNTPVDSIKELSTEINNEIFNIFNWAISEEAKAQLKK